MVCWVHVIHEVSGLDFETLFHFDEYGINEDILASRPGV